MNLNLKKGLLINAEAYSKIINKKDRTVVTLFSDAASVAILENGSSYSDIVSFNFGTDGTGYKNLIVPVGGSKSKRNENTAKVKKFSQGTFRSQENLFMDGYEISKFVYKEIPQSIFHLINEAGQNIDSIDRYFFHQPNKYLLESLSQRMKIDPQKVYIDLSNGNTVSCSIPIALKDFYTINKSVEDKILLLSGFGVGYSWANSIIKINNKFKENI